jgi:hypothetical protein
VRPFANSDELGQAVHSIFGYPPDHPPDAEVPEEYVKECKARQDRIERVLDWQITVLHLLAQKSDLNVPPPPFSLRKRTQRSRISRQVC